MIKLYKLLSFLIKLEFDNTAWTIRMIDVVSTRVSTIFQHLIVKELCRSPSQPPVTSQPRVKFELGWNSFFISFLFIATTVPSPGSKLLAKGNLTAWWQTIDSMKLGTGIAWSYGEGNCPSFSVQLSALGSISSHNWVNRWISPHIHLRFTSEMRPSKPTQIYVYNSINRQHGFQNLTFIYCRLHLVSIAVKIIHMTLRSSYKGFHLALQKLFWRAKNLG